MCIGRATIVQRTRIYKPRENHQIITLPRATLFEKVLSCRDNARAFTTTHAFTGPISLPPNSPISVLLPLCSSLREHTSQPESTHKFQLKSHHRSTRVFQVPFFPVFSCKLSRVNRHRVKMHAYFLIIFVSCLSTDWFIYSPLFGLTFQLLNQNKIRLLCYRVHGVSMAITTANIIPVNTASIQVTHCFGYLWNRDWNQGKYRQFSKQLPIGRPFTNEQFASTIARVSNTCSTAVICDNVNLSSISRSGCVSFPIPRQFSNQLILCGHYFSMTRLCIKWISSVCIKDASQINSQHSSWNRHAHVFKHDGSCGIQQWWRDLADWTFDSLQQYNNTTIQNTPPECIYNNDKAKYSNRSSMNSR